MVPCARLRMPDSDDEAEGVPPVMGGGRTEVPTPSMSSGYSPSESGDEPDDSWLADHPMVEDAEDDECPEMSWPKDHEEADQYNEEMEEAEETEEEETSHPSDEDDKTLGEVLSSATLRRIRSMTSPTDEGGPSSSGAPASDASILDERS